MNDKPAAKSPRTWIERVFSAIAHEPQNREELMTILRDAQTRDLLSADILGMIERILQVSDMQVRDVMIPKTQMAVIKKDSTFEKILPIVIQSGHSRFPVIDPRTKDVIGILLAKDLLKYTEKDKAEFRIADILRSAIFTSQSKRLDILLREFRVNRNHLAIVLDEYGYVAGLVTIEDVLEQIVGEIEDEYDIEEEADKVKQLTDGSYIVQASTLIEEFNHYFHTDFSTDEFDTIGGIVIHAFGHLPKRGETIKIHAMRFKILHSDSRRIYLLEVKPVKKRSHATP